MSDKDLGGSVDALQWYSLDELCRRPRLDADFVLQCMEAGIVELQAHEPPGRWRFSAAMVLRIERARRLQHDLEVQLNDLALVLDLLDEVESLRGEVASLRRRLQYWES